MPRRGRKRGRLSFNGVPKRLKLINNDLESSVFNEVVSTVNVEGEYFDSSVSEDIGSTVDEVSSVGESVGSTVNLVLSVNENIGCSENVELVSSLTQAVNEVVSSVSENLGDEVQVSTANIYFNINEEVTTASETICSANEEVSTVSDICSTMSEELVSSNNDYRVLIRNEEDLVSTVANETVSSANGISIVKAETTSVCDAVDSTMNVYKSVQTGNAVVSTANNESNEVIDLTEISDNESASSSVSNVNNRNINQNPGPSYNAIPSTSSTTDTDNSYECPICLLPCIHPAKLPCSHVFCYLCVKGIARLNQPCPLCRSPIPNAYANNPHHQPVQKSCPEKQAEDVKYYWFYKGRSNGWWQYEDRMSEEIEENYLLGTTNFEMMICGTLYVIDIANNVQYPKYCPGRTRRLLREVPSRVHKLGVAGMRAEPRNDI